MGVPEDWPCKPPCQFGFRMTDGESGGLYSIMVGMLLLYSPAVLLTDKRGRCDFLSLRLHRCWLLGFIPDRIAIMYTNICKRSYGVMIVFSRNVIPSCNRQPRALKPVSLLSYLGLLSCVYIQVFRTNVTFYINTSMMHSEMKATH